MIDTHTIRRLTEQYFYYIYNQDSARRSEEEIKTRKLQHLQAMEHSKAKESQLKQEIESTESTLSKTSKLLEDQLQENLSLRATVSVQTANQLLLEGENSALKQKDEVRFCIFVFYSEKKYRSDAAMSSC